MKDALGVEISVGDVIAYNMSKRHGTLGFYEVLEVTKDKNGWDLIVAMNIRPQSKWQEDHGCKRQKSRLGHGSRAMVLEMCVLEVEKGLAK